MTREVAWSPGAVADLRKLDPPIAARVVEAVTRFAECGQGDVRRLQAVSREFRLRVGDWRVRFDETPERAIHVLRVLHRSGVYR